MVEIENKNEIVVNNQISGKKAWCAKIVGKDAKYGYGREFLNRLEENMSSSGKTGNARFVLREDGYYEVHESWKGRHYLKVVSGEAEYIEQAEIEKVFA